MFIVYFVIFDGGSNIVFTTDGDDSTVADSFRDVNAGCSLSIWPKTIFILIGVSFIFTFIFMLW